MMKAYPLRRAKKLDEKKKIIRPFDTFELWIASVVRCLHAHAALMPSYYILVKRVACLRLCIRYLAFSKVELNGILVLAHEAYLVHPRNHPQDNYPSKIGTLGSVGFFFMFSMSFQVPLKVFIAIPLIQPFKLHMMDIYQHLRCDT